MIKDSIIASLKLFSCILLFFLINGCQTLGTAPSQPTDKTVAQIGGGLVGGLVGNQFGGGNGKTLMTIAGAIGGAYLGGELIGDEERKTAQSNPYEQAEVVQRASEPTLNKYCHKLIKYHKDVPVDVDVAYIRYKRTFGYMTHHEHIRAQGLDPATANPMFTQMDRGYRHTVEPGVRYHMKEEVDLDTGYYIGWLSLELEKAGHEKTRVHVNYCEGGENGFDPKYSRVIRKKVEKGYI